MPSLCSEIPPVVLSGDDRSISEIVSDLRATFRAVDFDRAEADLVARETALRRNFELLNQENQSLTELLELERLEMASLREELEAALKRASESAAGKLLEEKDGEIRELKRRLAEAEMWKTLHEAKETRVATVEADAVGLVRTGDSPAPTKAASPLAEAIGENTSSHNAGDANSTPKIPVLVIVSDDDDNNDGAEDGCPSKNELHPKVLKRKRSSSPNLSTNRIKEDTGDHDISNGNMGNSLLNSSASVANTKHLTKIDSPFSNCAETPCSTQSKTRAVLGRCSGNASTVAENTSPANLSKSFWEKFGDIKFQHANSSSSSSSSESNGDNNS